MYIIYIYIIFCEYRPRPLVGAVSSCQTVATEVLKRRHFYTEALCVNIRFDLCI